MPVSGGNPCELVSVFVFLGPVSGPERQFAPIGGTDRILPSLVLLDLGALREIPGAITPPPSR